MKSETSTKEIVNGFELLDDVYIFNGRACKAYIPVVHFHDQSGIAIKECVWIKYLDDNDVKIVPIEELEYLPSSKLLYG